MATLLAHIRDEEILLPAWCKHHNRIFSNGVIYNAKSTDKSEEIIRDLCPGWKIVNMPPEKMDMINVDHQIIMDLESDIKGWKICLNISEFILNNLDDYIISFEKENPNDVGVAAAGYIIVDRPGETSLNLVKDGFLLDKTFGYRETGLSWNGDHNNFKGITNEYYRSRVLHKSTHGNYCAGRHLSNLPRIDIDENLILAYVSRGLPELHHARCEEPEMSKKQIKEGLKTFGDASMWTIEYCYRFWETELDKSYELTEKHPEYKIQIDNLKRLYIEKP